MRIILLLVANYFALIPVIGQPVGPNSTANGKTEIVSGSFAGWDKLGNAVASDDLYVESGFLTGTIRQSSRFIASGFGFAIPSNKTITGISVSVERLATADKNIRDYEVMLVKGGSVQEAENKKNRNRWLPAKEAVTYGSSLDLWNNSWSPADINSPEFGIAISVERLDPVESSERALIDHITITVYLASTLPVSLVDFKVSRADQQQNVSVQWKSINEQNLAHFEIEHSRNGTQYSPVKKLMPIATNANEKKYIVPAVLLLPGLNYYRLKAVDKDGKTTYSEVATVSNTNTAVKNFMLVSNLVSTEIKIRVLNPDLVNKPVILSLYNENGALLQKNSFVIKNQDELISIPLQKIQPGLHFLNWQCENILYNEKIVIR